MRHALGSAGLAVLLAMCGTVIAAEKKADAAHVRKDIGDHRAMADAHSNAARCLEAGTPESQCHEQLAKDCKGLGLGKYCGMKHKH